MDIQKGRDFSEAERQAIEHHKFLARDAYEERERDRKSGAAVWCFDLENVLAMPRTTVSNFFHKRKLSVYNLTVHCSVDKNVFCAVWNEAENGRGGNAIASALLKVLDQFVQMHTTNSEIILWSDSCVPQNRNSLMAYAL
ncbi:DNA repair protein rhp54 [Plakobranchus ocellatus]|uniref:DNA repair protein rhp54 n=1 Tax=Plakobranchus ocellatus TaxID=259542 RepID=A0AAV3XVD8_9GAST|nr:DNA repair protein rhp54 [Plakobranchus ocellatus]